MPASSDAQALQAGMRQIERALQQSFDEALPPDAGPAALSFEWKGGQAGGDIPVAEAVTLEASSPQGDGKLALRHDAVAACAGKVQADVADQLALMAGRMAAGG